MNVKEEKQSEFMYQRGVIEKQQLQISELQSLLKEKEDEVKELKEIIKQLTEDFAVGIQQRDETIGELMEEIEFLKM